MCNTTFYIIYFSDVECFTKSGPETGKLCAFPFIYEGNTYEKCTAIDHDQFWCSTEVDHNGVHARGKWGNCGNECNSGKVTGFFSFLAKDFEVFPIEYNLVLH